MKLAVYAICKNESANVLGFLDMVQEADSIVILDTGSTDGTPDLIKALAASRNLPVRVESAILDPFDFSIARNMALAMAVETGCDYGISIDFDERTPAGWVDSIRAVHELNIDKGPNVFATTMQLLDSDGNVVTTYHQHKTTLLSMPANWAYAAHEVLYHPGVDVVIIDSGVKFTHHKDEKKPRAYLDLLANDYAKYPRDHRSIFYYGRELYYAGRYDEAAEVLLTADATCHNYFVSQHLELLRTLSHCTSDERYLYEALAICPASPFLAYDLALFMYTKGKYYASVGFCEISIESRRQDNLYENDVLFPDPTMLTWKLYDVMSNAYWEMGDKERAQVAVRAALEYAPTNQRLIANAAFITAALVEGYNDADRPDDLTVSDAPQAADYSSAVVEKT